uniref:hypothetical protein n=1 Tax=Fodinicola feengrottensis TaxID=435914 RepID=UPI0013D00575|nr:hypothetical protein [Fodinicola feengrottensis]
MAVLAQGLRDHSRTGLWRQDRQQWLRSVRPEGGDQRGGPLQVLLQLRGLGPAGPQLAAEGLVVGQREQLGGG